MIRNEREYQAAMGRLEEEEARLESQLERLKAEGLSAEQITRVLDPVRSFHAQLVDEVRYYERLKQGDLGGAVGFQSLGRMLVALRIAMGLSQRELANRLGVHESLVSRDEQNEYHGITLQRAGRILEALGVELTVSFPEIRVTEDGSVQGRVRAEVVGG